MRLFSPLIIGFFSSLSIDRPVAAFKHVDLRWSRGVRQQALPEVRHQAGLGLVIGAQLRRVHQEGTRHVRAQASVVEFHHLRLLMFLPTGETWDKPRISL